MKLDGRLTDGKSDGTASITLALSGTDSAALAYSPF